jgi:putative component of membrane protein insertase Oxa1/YidC/SpoIIIJ protein YidD
MKSLALSAIRFYQRALSPHKGFCCAYAACSGRASCSELGFRAIRRLGVWQGLGALDRRLYKCGVAARRRAGPQRGPGRQAGFCDIGGCDVGSCDLPGCDVRACDVPACDCGGCDWKRRSRGDDDYVVIPARGNVRN